MNQEAREAPESVKWAVLNTMMDCGTGHHDGYDLVAAAAVQAIRALPPDQRAQLCGFKEVEAHAVDGGLYMEGGESVRVWVEDVESPEGVPVSAEDYNRFRRVEE